jgi:hypothetical protein
VFGEIRKAYLSILVVNCEVEEDAVDGEHILEREGAGVNWAMASHTGGGSGFKFIACGWRSEQLEVVLRP